MRRALAVIFACLMASSSWAALTFPNATDNVDVGSASSIDDVNKGTIIAWVYRSSNAVGRIWQKGIGASNNQHYFGNSASAVELVIKRTTNCFATSAFGNFANDGTSKWLFYAATFDTGGANGDQKLYIGDLSAVAAVPSSYSTQTVGSGTVGSDAGDNGFLGNNSASGGHWPGHIAYVQIISGTLLTSGQIASMQWRPRMVAGTVGLWILGYNGTSTQPDWSGSGNNGTVTGATVVDHPPLGAPWASNGDPFRWFRGPFTELVRRFEIPSIREILRLT